MKTPPPAQPRHVPPAPQSPSPENAPSIEALLKRDLQAWIVAKDLIERAAS